MDDSILLEPKEAIEKLISIGWSQRKIARFVGCSQSQINRAMTNAKGKCDYKIADKLRSTIESLKNYHEALNENQRRN